MENNKLSSDQCVCTDYTKLIKGVTATFMGAKKNELNWSREDALIIIKSFEGSDRSSGVRAVACICLAINARPGLPDATTRLRVLLEQLQRFSAKISSQILLV